MITLDWKPLGINVDDKLKNEINIHNGTIMEKTDHFEDIIILSSTDNKEKYLKLFNEQRDTLAIITTYHDIGKVREKLNHGEHSYDIIQETNILAEKLYELNICYNPSTAVWIIKDKQRLD